MNQQKTIPCKYCGEQTRMLSAKLCGDCWEINRRIQADPDLAARILKDLEGEAG